MRKYNESKEGKSVNYDEIDQIMDSSQMVKMIKKPQEDGKKRKISKRSKMMMKELEQAIGKKGSKDVPSSDLAGVLLQQSNEYQSQKPEVKDESRMQEIEKLNEIVQEKPNVVTKQTIGKYLDAYKGNLAIRDVRNEDKIKLMDLREKATQDSSKANSE